MQLVLAWPDVVVVVVVVVGERGGVLSGLLVEEDAALDGLAADGALAHSVAAQLAGAVAAQEDHVLQPVQAHRAHGLTDGRMDGRAGRRTDRRKAGRRDKERCHNDVSKKRGKKTVSGGADPPV